MQLPFNGSRQIRHTSKGPIVYCKNYMLSCKREKRKEERKDQQPSCVIYGYQQQCQKFQHGKWRAHHS